MDAFCLDLAKNLFEGLVTAGIHLDTLPSSFLYDPMRKVLYGVQNAGASVISLFLMLRCVEHPVDAFRHVGSEDRCPSTIIGTILSVDFFVIKVFRPHMAILGDIQRKLFIRPFMGADQTVILIAYPYLR